MRIAEQRHQPVAELLQHMAAQLGHRRRSLVEVSDAGSQARRAPHARRGAPELSALSRMRQAAPRGSRGPAERRRRRRRPAIDLAERAARHGIDSPQLLRRLVIRELPLGVVQNGAKRGIASATAATRWPSTGSGIPKTTASRTRGWLSRTRSTSTGEMFDPPRMMRSFLRPTNHSSSPSPYLAEKVP